MKKTYQTIFGELIQLGAKLGGGGEGEVYEILNDPRFCAKIYFQTTKATKMESKIEAMIQIYKKVRAGEPYKEYLFDHHLAWPRAKLYDPEDKYFVGFIMNRLDLSKAIILDEFFSASMDGEKHWANRLKVALNLFELLCFLHSINVIVGDLHEDNIFIQPDLKVVFIDCDSFQIQSRFPCSAMRFEISPPEASHSPYLEPSSDYFAYTILLYRLLMDGFNPFSFCQNPAEKDIELQERKEKGLAPIRNPSLLLPKASPSLDRLPPDLKNLMAQGLDPDKTKRFSPDELIKILEYHANHTIICPKGHINPTHLIHCLVCGKQIRPTPRLIKIRPYLIALFVFFMVLIPSGNFHLLETGTHLFKEGKNWVYTKIEQGWSKINEWVESENTSLLEENLFVFIPAGSFRRRIKGSIQTVVINKPFYIMRKEVTQALWKKIMGYNPSSNRCPECPVENISWEEAQTFISILNEKENAHYRLPTEAEWDYACDKGIEVGKKVAEWCLDWYAEEPFFQKKRVIDPKGPGFGSHKVVKQQSSNTQNGLHITIRRFLRPFERKSNVGFRLVKDIIFPPSR